LAGLILGAYNEESNIAREAKPTGTAGGVKGSARVSPAVKHDESFVVVSADGLTN
jgi:NDP-sugar pyrophosphorylase family protein